MVGHGAMDGLGSLVRAGESDSVDFRIAGECRTNLRATRKAGKRCLWYTRCVQQGESPQTDTRCLLRGLCESGVVRCKGHRNLAGEDRERRFHGAIQANRPSTGALSPPASTG